MQQFYSDGRVDRAEAERLSLMASWADRGSLAAMASQLLAIEDPVMVDIGAGDSPSLGRAVVERNPTATYIPVDTRGAAVRAQREAGLPAEQGSATDLPLCDGLGDMVHPRFDVGCMDRSARCRCLDECLRISKGQARLLIADCDWVLASGYVRGATFRASVGPWVARMGSDAGAHRGVGEVMAFIGRRPRDAAARTPDHA